ncbi:DUF4232 domain-containing protein, partial [Streptomyces olivaceoviridis]
MRMRAVIAVPAASAAVAALLLTAPQSQAAPGQDRPARCAEKALTIRAKAVTGHPTVLRTSVTNRGTTACGVDRGPTGNIGDQDGIALTVAEGGPGGNRRA